MDTLTLAEVPELADVLAARTPLTIAGWSMYPALRRGDRVVIEPLQQRSPDIGDLVVFRQDAAWICHRVVRVISDGASSTVITQGDAVSRADAPVPLARLLGRVVSVEPRHRAPAWLEPWAVRWWRACERGKRRLVAWVDHARRLACVRWLARHTTFSATSLVVGVPVEPGSRFTAWATWAQALQRLNANTPPASLRLMLRHRDACIGQARLCQRLGREWRVETIEVRWRWRGRGHGAQLLRAAIEFARHAKAELLVADVPATAVAARDCFQRAGFERLAAQDTRLCYALARAATPLRDHAEGVALPLYQPQRRRTLTREERVLQWSAWLDEEQALKELLALAREPLDWWFALHQARHHGVTTLLYDRLRQLPRELIPATIFEALRQGYYQQLAASTAQHHAATETARLLQVAGVRVVALKGLGIAERYYTQSVLRPMADVDFLVETAALARADAALTSAGYTRLHAAQLAYGGPPHAGGFILELHPPEEHPFYDLRALAERARRDDGAPYAIPTPEDCLLFAGLHAALHHVWLRLLWVSDVARIIAHPRHAPDWAIVRERLREHPARFAMGHVLRAAQEWCGAAVPADVVALCAPRQAERRHDRLLSWLLAHPPIPRLNFVVMYGLGRLPSVSLGGFRQRLIPSISVAQRRSGHAGGASLAAWHVTRAARLARHGLGIGAQFLAYLWRDWQHRW